MRLAFVQRIGHSMFGIGMYLTARLMEAVD
jgi:hypothetical protein